MQGKALVFGLLVLCACAHGTFSDEGGTVPDKMTAFLAADAKCHERGRFAGVRSIDHARNLVLYDCVDTRNRFPIGSINLHDQPKTAFQ
jgi:hypothetical protein